MKKHVFTLLVIFGLLVFASPSLAVPTLNTAGDGIEDIGNTPYATYQNSGDFLFFYGRKQFKHGSLNTGNHLVYKGL